MLDKDQRQLQLFPPGGHLEVIASDILGLFSRSMSEKQFVTITTDQYSKLVRDFLKPNITYSHAFHIVSINLVTSNLISDIILPEYHQQSVINCFISQCSFLVVRNILTITCYPQTKRPVECYKYSFIVTFVTGGE